MTTPRKGRRNTPRVQDDRRRAQAVREATRTMAAVDAFADRLRGPAARAYKTTPPLTTWHNGLWGSFTIHGDHAKAGGLHIRVTGHRSRVGDTRVAYRIEVCGPDDLTEADAERVIRHLMRLSMPSLAWKETA